MAVFVALILSLLLTACGGGGGGGGGTTVNPADSYTGATSQAAVTSENAEGLALSVFGLGRVASEIGALRAPANRPNGARKVWELAQALRQSVRKLEFPCWNSELQTRPRTSLGVPRVLGRARSFQVNGDEGGYASFTLDEDESTGSFAGQVVYHGYASGGIVLEGGADVEGHVDLNSGELTRLTLSFRSLSMHVGTAEISLVGVLSWKLNLAVSFERLTINMVFVDREDSRTYWLRDYELATTYGGASVSQTLSGRYYDPDHGYVDVTTPVAMAAPYESAWPTQGAVRLSGRLDSWVRVTFFDYSAQVAVDADGDGAAEWQVEWTTNDEPVLRSPPVADAGADQNVLEGAAVTLDGGASYDPDGDVLSYFWAFQSCPEYSCPILTGANAAAASFVADRSGTYVLGLTVFDGEAFSPTDTVTVVASPAPPSDADLLTLGWQYGLFGTSIGRAGLLIADLDGDGSSEVVASASAGGFGANSFWYVVRRSAGGTYKATWPLVGDAVPIVRLAAVDMTGDGADEVVVGLSDGTVRVHDGSTLVETTRFSVAPPLTDLAVADLDGDGKQEIATSDGTAVSVYAAESGEPEWSISAGGGDALALGNVDDDPSLEIVTTSQGDRGWVIDATSRSVEWEYVDGFGVRVGLGDVDGDGRKEIVGAAAWDRITVFDAERKTPAWEIPTDHDIGALLVADADGDGVPEVVYGDGQWGRVRAVDGQTRVEEWSVSNPEHGVSGIALADVDEDGQVEVLWGAGGASSGPDHLYVADPSTGAVEWESAHVDGPLSAVAVGDLDDDGGDEVLMVSSESDSGYAEGVIHIFDARTHALEYQEKLGTMDWMGVRSVVIGDVDGDGATEFAVGTAHIYGGVVRVYDGAAHVLERESAEYSGNYFSALALGDVDGDGLPEIVAGQGREHTGAQGVYLIVFDGATLEEKWRSVDLGTYWGSVYDIELADTDADGNVEIIVSTSADRLFIYDGVTHDLQGLLEHPARALAVADADGDGASEVLAGRDNGQIDLLGGTTFAVEATVPTFGTDPVNALKVADLDGDGAAEWLLTRGRELVVLSAQDQGLKWRSPVLSGNLGLHNHLVVRDTDGNGRPEVFLGSDRALYQFE